MAGHSHAKNVKRKKEAGEKKRATTFARASRIIISAVREGGKDPKSNPALKLAIEKAKESEVPKENIERAIKRGAGEGEEGVLENFSFECYGPENTAIIIEGSTDNKNRTLGEIKEVLKANNGKLANSGSVKWLFDPKGVIEVEKVSIDENIMLKIIESGTDDIVESEEFFIIYTNPNNLNDVKHILLNNNISISSSYLGWRAKTTLTIKKESSLKLIDELKNNEAVENIFINIRLHLE